MAETSLHYADYIVFGLLLLMSASLGPFYMWKDRKKKITTSESYFLGDRAMHFIPVAASLFASFWSAIALVGCTAELYTGGAKFFMNSIGQSIGVVIGAFLVVPMMYNLKLISTYQYLDLRFKSKMVRYVGTTAGVLTNIFNLAVTTYAPCVALATVTPIPVWASVTVTGIVTMIYTVLGGIRAVVMVDLLQAIIMFLGVVIATAVGYSKIDGGIGAAMEIAEKGQRLVFFDWDPDIRNTYSIYAMIFPPIVFAAGYHATSQPAVQRYSAVPNVTQAKLALLSMAPQTIIFSVILFLMAIVMYVHYELAGCDPLRGKLISNSNQLTTYYVAEVLNYPGLLGLWFAALFSGSLSTMSTGYNSVAAIVWEDLLKQHLEHKLSPRGISAALKVLTLILAVGACLLAIVFEWFGSGIVKLTMSTVSIFGAAVFLCFFAGALFPFVNPIGILAGMISSTLVVVFIASGQLIFGLGNDEVWLPTTTTNCASLANTPISNWKNVTVPKAKWNDPAILPPSLKYIFSMSYFLFPFFSVLTGVVVSVVVSLLSGGIEFARTVEERLLVVKNCFLKPPSSTEGNEISAASDIATSTL